MSKIERIHDIEYLQGYTAAILDAIRVVEYIDYDMRNHGIRWSKQTVLSLLNVLSKNRGELRNNPDLFVRCNKSVEGNFEIWENWKNENK